MPDILRMLSQAEQLDFSQNFLMPRANYLGDAIFPDQKTQNFKAEYLRLAAGAQLPTMALIHGLDTEAHIASRPALERVTVEKLFIKEKINQTESLRQALENGAFNDSALITYVYDDWARLAEGVRCRSEAAKMEVLSTGKMTVKENGLNFSVDFGVPNGNADESQANFCGQCGQAIDWTEPEVHCGDCEHLTFSDCYGECGKGYKGIVQPGDSCGKGEHK